MELRGRIVSPRADELAPSILLCLKILRSRLEGGGKRLGGLQEGLVKRVNDCLLVISRRLVPSPLGRLFLQVCDRVLEPRDVVLDNVGQLVDTLRLIAKGGLRLGQLCEFAELEGRLMDLNTQLGGARCKGFGGLDNLRRSPRNLDKVLG